MKKKDPTPELSAKEIEAQIRQQLQVDTNMQKWFEQFNKYSWDYFIQRYAFLKYLSLRHPDLYINDFKPENKQYNELAKEALEAIQQKKLFNLQCQWRAGSIDLPFVQLTYDFELIGRKLIMECPFLPPVEQDEVELFVQYLRSSASADLNLYDMYDWQNYDQMREEDETGEFCSTPSWYEYYDSMRGTGYLLRLSNARGLKEDNYMEIALDHQRPDRHDHTPNPESLKPSPDYDAKIDFARCFEAPEVMESIISHIKTDKRNGDHEMLDSDYEFLKSIPDTIPFEPHHDWRESLRLTVIFYRNNKIAEALPRVWRHYYRPVGNAPEAYVRKRIATADFDLAKLDDCGVRHILIDRLLKGRELLGEPRDFNF